MFDLIIIGAGPAGISAAYEAKKAGLDYVVIEKGLIANTVYHYPVGLTVFSTTNELEFEPGDLKPAREKPTREELLSYYVRFVLDNELNLHTLEQVQSVQNLEESRAKTPGSEEETGFKITTTKAEYLARNVLFAIGAMDYPRQARCSGRRPAKGTRSFS